MSKESEISGKEALEQACREGGDKKQKDTYLELGNACESNGEYQKAIQHYQKALNIALERRDKWQEGQASLGLGYAYVNIGQYQKAIQHYQKALNIALDRKDKLQEGKSYRGLGSAYVNIGQYQTSIEHYQKALSIALERRDKCQEGKAYLGLGCAYVNIGQYQTSIEHYRKALNIAQDRKDKLQERQAYRGLGDVYQKVKDLPLKQTPKTFVEFASPQYAVLESAKLVKIAITRTGNIKIPAVVNFETIDGTAFAETDYIANKDTLVFKPDETIKHIAIEIIDDNEWEEDEVFFVKLSIYDASEKNVQIGHQSITEVTIINDDAQRNVQWSKTSIKHRMKFEKFVKILKTEPTMAIKIGQYSVCLQPEFVIGRGSDGTTVYIGLSDDGIEVAVKCLLLDRCNQLGSNEKEILNSPMIRKEQHIVNYRFYTEDVDSLHAYLVLDLCEENLQDYVLSKDRSKELLQSSGQAFSRQILNGLKALHSSNPVILHRDLKPSNIFLNVEGEIVLADFGLSQKLRDEETTHRSDQRGTQGWIAVESLPTEEGGENMSIEERKVRYKKQSDIQVAGMVIFYILTKGGHPYGSSYIRTSNVMQGKAGRRQLRCGQATEC